MCDHLPTWIAFYENEILPHPLFNDEELFNQFINSPLDENNILYTFLDFD